MKKLKTSLGRLIIACAASLTIAGCARGGEDLWDRTGDHVEWHVLQYWKNAVDAHETFDRYFLDRDPMDPNSYGREVTR